mgnify:CR=1 FL=1
MEVELITLSEQRKAAIIRRRLAYQKRNTLQQVNLHQKSKFVNSRSIKHKFFINYIVQQSFIGNLCTCYLSSSVKLTNTNSVNSDNSVYIFIMQVVTQSVGVCGLIISCVRGESAREEDVQQSKCH